MVNKGLEDKGWRYSDSPEGNEPSKDGFRLIQVPSVEHEYCDTVVEHCFKDRVLWGG